MKKVNIKMVVVLACMTLGFANVANAQISSSYERLFYTRAGKDVNSLSYCVQFQSNRVWLKEVSYSEVRKKLAESSSYYDSEHWNDKGTEPHYVWGIGTEGKCER